MEQDFDLFDFAQSQAEIQDTPAETEPGNGQSADKGLTKAQLRHLKRSAPF